MKIKTMKLTAETKIKTVKVQKGNEKIKVHIRKKVSFYSWIAMVQEIVGFAFDDKLEIIDGFQPQNLAYAKKYAIIKGFTDYEFPEITNESIEDIWQIVNYSGLYDVVASFAKRDVNEILAEADKMIQAKVDYLSNKTDLNALIDKFSKGLDSFSSQFTNMDANDVLEMVKKLQGVSADDIIGSMVKSIKGNQKVALK
jgi:hypothetical protein